MKITRAEFVKGIRGTDDILQSGIPQIACIGRSNVGKSSILNALVGLPGTKDLARVGKKPGKTTEINFFLINKKYYLVDLPGYGFASASPKEREKLRKLILWYFTSGEVRPHLAVLILEAKAGLTEFDEQMIAVLKEHQYPFVLVLNKIDKLTQKEITERLSHIREKIGTTEVIQTSTQTGKGIDALRARIFASIPPSTS